MRNFAREKSILMLVPLFLVLPFVNLAGAGKDAISDKDRVITSIVVDKFESDSQLRGAGIDVETKDGEVTLKGVINSHADITRASELARSVDGVKMVDNRLTRANSPHYKVIGPNHYCPDGPSIAWSC